MSDFPVYTKIDFSLIREHVIRAAAAYHDEDEIRRQFGQSAAVVHVDDPDGLELLTFVEIDEATRIQWVVVRGTDNFENVKSNLDVVKDQDEYAGVAIHSGFSECAEVAYQFALPLLHKDYETRLTGHSLGGAVASILAMRLSRLEFRLGPCVTFGQPKVTDEDGVNQFRDLPLYRFINGNDPVPALPPPIVGEFRHFGNEVHMLDDGTYENKSKYQSEVSENGSIIEKLFDFELDNHGIDHYLATISKKPVPVD
jgi:triacylglycerol lipase